jgi:hypothetical protein
MPYELELPKSLRRWKVKILDKETLYEEPHITIIFKTTIWRYGLRTQGFLDNSPDPADVPKKVLAAITSQHDELCKEWDARFPRNPVREPEEGEAQ